MCNLWFAVRYKKHDISDLKVIDILRKDFKRWTRVGVELNTHWIIITWYGIISDKILVS